MNDAKWRVDVLSDLQRNHNGKPFQVVGVHYPGAHLPVELTMYLGKGTPLAKGEYSLDPADGGFKPDPQNGNHPRFDFRQLKPVAKSKAA